MPTAREIAIAAVEREQARWRAHDEALALTPRRTRKVTGASIVYSLRLDPQEVRVLEERALALGIKPTVYARNLIRCGLGSAVGPDLADAIDRLDAAVNEVRSLIS